jgi:ergothioneine biosynthesis protein EgtB
LPLTATPVAAGATSGQSAAHAYQCVRRTTEMLCANLSAEDQMVQSMPDASPSKWHQAHTTWFFETFILAQHLPDYRAFHPNFRFLFNSYYKRLGAHFARPHRGLMSRPGLDEVRAYRRYVDEHMLDLLSGDTAPAVADKVVLGLNHEQQHQELIVTDIKHAFWMNPLRPEYSCGHLECSAAAPLAWLDFEGGVRAIGYEGEGFAFDNEGPRHQVYLNPFRLASRLASNAEFLEFMRDGGYARPELWLSDGWDAVQANAWHAPMYWEERDGAWWTFTCAGMRPVNPAEPVCHVSYYEADAYARWAGARLATEAEWEIAAGGVAVAGNFLDGGRFHPACAAEPQGLRQMFGDCWQWTQSSYLPYPGFRPAAGALGEYNGKFMCNQMVLRGASCATPRSHARASYRNFFPPHVRWQFMGIRLANDAS